MTENFHEAKMLLQINSDCYVKIMVLSHLNCTSCSFRFLSLPGNITLIASVEVDVPEAQRAEGILTSTAKNIFEKKGKIFS